MAMTPAEKQRRYRQRLKAKAAAGDEKAIKQVDKSRKLSTINSMRANCKRFLQKYATKDELKEFQKIIQKRLD